MTLRGKAAIVGIAEVDTFETEVVHRPGSRRRLPNAPLTTPECHSPKSTASSPRRRTTRCRRLTMSEYLGIRPRYTDSTALGGCSFIATSDTLPPPSRRDFVTSRSSVTAVRNAATVESSSATRNGSHTSNRMACFIRLGASASSRSVTWPSTARQVSNSPWPPSPPEVGH